MSRTVKGRMKRSNLRQQHFDFHDPCLLATDRPEVDLADSVLANALFSVTTVSPVAVLDATT